MSILKRQLDAIAATSTHQLDLKAQKSAHGKSLIFEPRIAASQDFHTIYQLCHESFEELCRLDGRFLVFSRSIFSEQSKTVERTQMTAADNSALDAVLESFLCLISGRILLKPAVKALEWLVRRYRIHEYNTEFTILTFLPYYSHHLFTTLLSILPRQISQTWRFLYPHISSLSNPSRHEIIQNTTNNSALFSAINQYVLTVAKSGFASQTLLSFWATIATETTHNLLDKSLSGRETIHKQREEDLLLRIIPVLSEGLALKNVSELTVGCCMIATVLATKGALEDKVLNGLMEAISINWTSATADARLLALTVISQERNAARLPTPVVKALLKHVENIARTLEYVDQSCRADRLAVGLALGVLARIEKGKGLDWLSIFEQILTTDLLDDNQKSVLLQAALPVISNAGDRGQDGVRIRDAVDDMFVRLSEYPTISKPLKNVLSQRLGDLDSLELKIKSVLILANSTEMDAKNGEVEISDNVKIGHQPGFKSITELIPQDVRNHGSFLAVGQSDVFKQLSESFIRATSSKANVKKLLDLLLPDNSKELGRTTLFSFLVRFWCGTYPSATRCIALEECKRQITDFHTQHQFDPQALIPYFLIALSDSSTGVRREAAACLATLSQFYETLTERKKKIKDLPVLATCDFYGKSSNTMNCLSTEEAAKFVKNVLMPGLEECVLDASRTNHTLVAGLNAVPKSLRSSICSLLSNHVSCTPLLYARIQLLSFLNLAGKVASSVRSRILLPSLKVWASQSPVEALNACESEALTISDVDRAYLEIIKPGEQEGIQALQSLIAGEMAKDRMDLQKDAFGRLKVIWANLKLQDQINFAGVLLNMSLQDSSDSQSVFQGGLSLETLRSLALPSDVLVTFLDDLPNAVHMPDKAPSAKRRRTSRAEMSRIDVTNTEETAKILQKYTLVLELAEGSNPEKHPELLRGLFHALAQIQQFRTQTSSNLVYLQSLTIGCLLSIVNRLKVSGDDNVDKSVIRADLLVDSVRDASNPQVQNSALLLISSLAAWVPGLVLHSVMPVFTFMSTSLMRQSDDYSAYVVNQTVSTVIPPLVASLRKRNQDLIIGAAEILFSFAAAFEHIPSHRRLTLFNQLVSTLGAEDSLFAVVAILLHKYRTDSKVVPFVMDLMRTFDALTELKAVKKYLESIIDSLKQRRTISEVLFSLNDKSPEYISATILRLLESLSEILHDQQLRSRLSKQLRVDGATSIAVRSVYADILERIISVSQLIKSQPDLHYAASNVLATLFGLIPTPEFVASTSSLLDNANAEVPRIVLKSFETQITSVKQGDDRSRDSILAFLTKLSSIIQETSDDALRRIAVTCVDQIAQKFGKKDTSTIVRTADVITGAKSLGSDDSTIRTLSLHCLASMVEVLQDEFVSLLPRVLPRCFEYLSESFHVKTINEQLYTASYSLLCSIFEHLPFMVSSTDMDSLIKLSHGFASAQLSSAAHNSRVNLLNLAATQLAPQECFSSIERNWDSAITTGVSALDEHLIMLAKAVEIHTKSTIVKNSQILFSFLLNAFDFRRLREAQGLVKFYSDSDIEHVEKELCDVAITMTMKLNDASFRPFFIRMVEWASKGLPKKDHRGRSLRLTSLFVFLDTFFYRLKSIVTSYSSYVLDAVVEIMGGKDSSLQSHKLRSVVMNALLKSFQYDQDDFWQNPSHFDVVVDPLLSQLSINSSDYIIEVVIPAVTEFAAAASSPDHHKEMNSKILKLMHSSKDAHIRLAAVKCEQSLTDRLGEDWLALLPEMLPVISELQEDDDEIVERETLRWIKRIEEILGESLDNMLQ
ncbi:hypothetical protein M501DRAFT_994555 [Patellaria atrata CBS 101060]|uniref:U3 small nucleolar RNA-associated protein 10 n=1 Tax=Patellaria atrata CBS 101060 TaxID=1346257 RepID=A0A9P4SJ14_9PEZI|nr:hypothetical protein M501DRAFT_994555 [Patellaria atrata CBS 101060]